ncbi:MAG: FAD/NAD(P)-binding protein [Planctomycetaceae bacterium]|nr:FAD/NAD(P)-binding protein [Planctomycetaceae bacterium]
MEKKRENIYKPYLMEVIGVTQQTADVKSVKIRFRDPETAEKFSFRVGQFGLYSVFGYGESTFNICSSSNWKDHIEFCFRKTGRVTEQMWNINVGDTIGFRGPYGNAYPTETWEGKDLIFVGGGIAMPPIRCAIWYALENRNKYGKITIVYGARTVGDLVFKDELKQWATYPNVEVLSTVDPGGETPDWDGRVGFVPTVLGEANIDCSNAAALVVGPPVMIKFSLPVLAKQGMSDADIYTSLENRMKCGLGKCGRCNCGPVYVCKEGPVFTLEQLKALPDDY